MKTIVLDGALMPTRQIAHDYLAARLDLPAYYGKNLDALYDCLTARGEETLLVVYHPDELRTYLEDYAAALLDTLWEAARDNRKLHIAVDGEESE